MCVSACPCFDTVQTQKICKCVLSTSLSVYTCTTLILPPSPFLSLRLMLLFLLSHRTKHLSYLLPSSSSHLPSHHTTPHCTTLHHTAPHHTTLHHTTPYTLHVQMEMKWRVVVPILLDGHSGGAYQVRTYVIVQHITVRCIVF